MPLTAVRQRKLCLALISIFSLVYAINVSLNIFIRNNANCSRRKLSNSILNRQIISNSVNSRESFNVVIRDTSNSDRHDALSRITRTDYFDCADFKKLSNQQQTIKDHLSGNRGISFINVKIDDAVVPAVYKKAANQLESFMEIYKYNSAKREVEFLFRLQGEPGIPKLLGSCVTNTSVEYVVERILGRTLCNDIGITTNCGKAYYLLKIIKEATDPTLAALTLAYTTARLFKLLEERHLFFEDISGVNLMINSKFELFLVDADSLIMYKNNRIFSQLLCSKDHQCSGPKGSLWEQASLNIQIYQNCDDFRGICERGKCRGFDVSLHACGMANWYLCLLTRFFEHLPYVHDEYQDVCSCMRQPHPHQRCSFATAAARMGKLLKLYQKGK